MEIGKIQCPSCGNFVYPSNLEIMDNGNVRCSDCAKDRKKNEEPTLK